MYNIILRNYKQAEPSLQVVIALAKVGSTFLDREKKIHNHRLFKMTKFSVRRIKIPIPRHCKRKMC